MDHINPTNSKNIEPAPITPPEKNKKETTPKTPAEEINNFISEFNLEPLLPSEFYNLNEPQKLKVIQDLKHRIVDIVKSEAQTQYSEGLKGQSIFKSIKNSITKERGLKKAENEAFKMLRDSNEGKILIMEDLMRLVEMRKDRDIYIHNGKPYISYLKHFNIRDVTSEEIDVSYKFSEKTYIFTQMPYEWGQEKSGKHKKEYEKAKAEYDTARNEILKIKEEKEIPEEKGKAMLEMLEIDNTVQIEQLLNTHPEFEKALNDFGKSAGGKEMVKTAGKFLNTLSGKNWTNRALTAGGFIARMGAKGATILTGATMCTALGAPVVGGIVGGARGYFRAKDTLLEKQKNARHGQKDTTKEKAKMVDAATLTLGLEKMANQAEVAIVEEEKAKILGKLAVVINYTQDQIEKGQVNFGNAKSALTNQFDLINNLNRALIAKESNSSTVNKELEEKINGLIAIQSKQVKGKISKTQKEFIRK